MVVSCERVTGDSLVSLCYGVSCCLRSLTNHISKTRTQCSVIIILVKNCIVFQGRKTLFLFWEDSPRRYFSFSTPFITCKSPLTVTFVMYSFVYTTSIWSGSFIKCRNCSSLFFLTIVYSICRLSLSLFLVTSFEFLS